MITGRCTNNGPMRSVDKLSHYRFRCRQRLRIPAFTKELFKFSNYSRSIDFVTPRFWQQVLAGELRNRNLFKLFSQPFPSLQEEYLRLDETNYRDHIWLLFPKADYSLFRKKDAHDHFRHRLLKS